MWANRRPSSMASGSKSARLMALAVAASRHFLTSAVQYAQRYKAKCFKIIYLAGVLALRICGDLPHMASLALPKPFFARLFAILRQQIAGNAPSSKRKL